jgi:lipopolysaccharide export system protein LptA
MRYLITIIAALFIFHSGFSQKKSRIKLVRADNLRYDKRLGSDVQRVIGNVVFKHKTTLLYCDSAYLYGKNNSVNAYGNVHINDNDSVHIYSDSLHYSGDERMAELFNNIRMTDPTMTLTTNHLKYDLKRKTGHYYGGGKIVDSANVLVSKYGYYYTRTKDLFFKKDVVLTNPEYVIYCDTLIYNTVSEVSNFYGPTTIKSSENTIFCERGWYDTRTNRSRFQKNAYLENKNQKILGDSMYYDRNLDFGQAFRNVVLIDTSQNLTVLSEYVEYDGKNLFVMSTDSALAIVEDEDKDSLFLHADTLILFFDSLQQAREVFAYHKASLYKSNLQAVCDSLVYSFRDSVIELHTGPVIWSGKSQLTGEYVEILTSGNKPKEMHIGKNAFILSNDTMDYYNQISGKKMIGYFRDNEFRRLDVFGNAETVYFARDEDKNLIGVDISIAGDLKILVEDKQIKDIIYFDDPEGTIYPLKDLSPRDMRLKNFRNYDYRRPNDRYDVFSWKP